MWQIDELESTQSNTKFSILEDEVRISNDCFLNLLKDSQRFRDFYNGYLADSRFEAFFWENKPVTLNTLKEGYECNLVNSGFLAGRSPDPEAFSSYFKKDKPVVSFPNLGRDARLIVPCPFSSHSVYTHIGNFVQEAPASQIREFWRTVGVEMLEHISDKPKWLSTSGLGVFWLHVRIDEYPKYYQTEDYKRV